MLELPAFPLVAASPRRSTVFASLPPAAQPGALWRPPAAPPGEAPAQAPADPSLRAVLVECDPGGTLGDSCLRDVGNLARALARAGCAAGRIVALTSAPGLVPNLPPGAVRDSNSRIRENIQRVLADARGEPRAGRLAFALSGHGYSVADADGDEDDGRDEAIHVAALGFAGGARRAGAPWCLARGTPGLILDDDLRSWLAGAAPAGVELRLLADTCHSATMFDLPCRWSCGRWVAAGGPRPPGDAKQGPEGGPAPAPQGTAPVAYAIGACSDDAYAYCDVGTVSGFGGALTIQLLETPGAFEAWLRGDPRTAMEPLCRALAPHRQTPVLTASQAN